MAACGFLTIPCAVEVVDPVLASYTLSQTKLCSMPFLPYNVQRCMAPMYWIQTVKYFGYKQNTLMFRSIFSCSGLKSSFLFHITCFTYRNLPCQVQEGIGLLLAFSHHSERHQWRSPTLCAGCLLTYYVIMCAIFNKLWGQQQATANNGWYFQRHCPQEDLLKHTTHLSQLG